ncbi:DMT family transporter [Aquibium sp. ELW1220]|uniref:DMT family transporter n=1 Tax=Aquibium sp. ELW1220 TaxID=2976766 RepID=UPI0025AF1583|nr:DMT family transporter [Aquibium sp. ELW1220]MDN2580030.1 DMT family transporter [Aquibium sp. ELW1220]
MHRAAYVLLLLTTMFWGGNAVAGKMAVGHVSPMLFVVLRWTVAFGLLYLIGHRQFRADWAAIRPRLAYLSAMGFFGFAAFNLALYGAFLYTSAVNGSIEHAGIPMAIFALNFLIFRQRVFAGQIFGFLLTFVGVVLTAAHGDLGGLLRLDLNRGDALVLVAVLVYAGYTVFLRYRPAIHWQSYMIVLSAAACLTSVPFAIAEHAAGALIWPDATGWGCVAYTAIFPSLLSQVFYMRGVEMIGANRAGLFINLVPIFGTLLSLMVLGEMLHGYHVVAIALAFAGIAIAEWSGRRRAAADAG